MDDTLEGEVESCHEATRCGVRAVVVTRSERAAGIVNIVAMIASESKDVLSRHIDADTTYVVAEPLVGQVTAKLNIGDLPISGILDLTVAEEVVPCQRGIVGQIGTGNARCVS